MPAWFAIILGLVVGVIPGFLAGRWATWNDQEDEAVRALDEMSATLEALPGTPCPHCGKMRGHR
jgi:uncharacterized membrane-anchored protein YhcB (DUF1043 family)